MRRLTFKGRIFILIGMFAATLVGLAFLPPIAQDPIYHNFSDTGRYLGIPNFGDVVSNAGFAVVGILGLLGILGRRGRAIFPDASEAFPFIVFFLGVCFVAVGSGYYHLAPNNDRLFWDRLPMTIAFMALFSAFIADRVDKAVGINWLMPLLIILGIASLLYWDWTEGQGQGDLRFYGLVQFYPVIALPMICWLFPKANHTSGRHLAWIIVWYAAAKLLEHFDNQIYALLGETVSGHSLKHLAAAMATYVVVRMVLRPRQR